MEKFSNVFIEATKDGKKIPKEQYLSIGKYPIIDQGQNEIAGYTNDNAGLYEDVPAIIFGDHTRVIKFVDKPFFLGADGVKLLKAKNRTANYKYLYYALSNIKIPNTGYNRHFKWLKEVKIKLYSKEIQENIVSVLDKVMNLIDKRKQQLEKLDELVKSRFVEMFGDSAINDKGWKTVPLMDMGECKNGMNFNHNEQGIEISCLGVGDFKDYSIIKDINLLPKVTLNEMPTEDYLLKDGDIVFVRSNGNKALVGRSVAVYPDKTPTTFSGFCIRYRNSSDLVIIPYLLRVLKTESMRKKMSGRGANIQNLNQQILASLIIPVPPLELQNQFADFVGQVDKSKAEIQKGLDKLELLKKALMQKYFG